MKCALSSPLIYFEVSGVFCGISKGAPILGESRKILLMLAFLLILVDTSLGVLNITVTTSLYLYTDVVRRPREGVQRLCKIGWKGKL